jgi:hypothetical protein
MKIRREEKTYADAEEKKIGKANGGGEKTETTWAMAF